MDIEKIIDTITDSKLDDTPIFKQLIVNTVKREFPQNVLLDEIIKTAKKK